MSNIKDEIWCDDLLSRRQDADILEAFLVRRHEERREAGQTGAYVVNLNAGWGLGKSFFMERLKRQLEASGHLTAFVNAWRDDSSREPVVAVMHAIEESLKPHFAVKNGLVKAWNSTKAHGATIVASMAKGASRRLAEKYTGQALREIGEFLDEQDRVPDHLEATLDEVSEKAAARTAAEVTTLLTKFVDDKITDYRARLASASQFQSRMRALLEQLAEKDGVKLPFFVLIDELDRCRPTYAIEMLEQVKHLFDIDNTVFVVSTDGDQLAHSVRAVYGTGFEGERYLRRFFHRHYQFTPADLRKLCDYLFAVNRIDLTKVSTPWEMAPSALFAGAMDRFDVTLRDAEQCFDILRSAITLWDHKTPILLNVILPMIIFHQRNEPANISAFIHGSTVRLAGDGNWSTIVDWGDRSGIKQYQVSIDDLNREILTRIDTPIPENIAFHPSSPTNHYVRNVFAAEFLSLHNNIYRGKGPKSVISEYANLVRQVGRLTAPDPAPQA
nr:P-loop NTPase fold protein [uncultured Brevundimonas sp.]